MSTKIIYNVSDLIIDLKATADLKNTVLIGIDGVDGCGKSKIAEDLSKQLSLCWIEIDKYLTTKQGGYVPFVKYDALRSDIKKTKQINKPLVTEGVCLLEVLDHIEERPDILIYVKRVKLMYGVESWYDDYLCDPSSDIYREAEDFLGKEIQKYHKKFRPVERANYFYHQDIDQLSS